MRHWNTPTIEFAKAIADRLTAAGAKECLLVGGFVRDQLMGIDSKDIDVEVYGLGYDDIVRALDGPFAVDLVGRSFGVVKVDNRVDISIPRRESKTGAGHRGFAVEPDPTMTPREAASRRDFTINAIGMRFDGTLVDPLDGQRDIERKVLRATGPAFAEDPLRVLRGMQFTARFGFEMDESTVEHCRQLVSEFQHLAAERIWDELLKWAVKGRHPGRGLQLLDRTGWLDCFPELAALRGVPQDPIWHPEGDVFVHTCYACDAAAAISDREKFDAQERAVVVFAVLCHDLAKCQTTVQNEHGRWIAPGHAGMGRPMAEAFLSRLRAPTWLIEQAPALVSEHMAMLGQPKDQPPSARTVRRLAVRLDRTSVRLWAAVCEADVRGRVPGGSGLEEPAPDCEEPEESLADQSRGREEQTTRRANRLGAWLEVAERLSVLDRQPKPILMGRHLIDAGFAPGRHFGRILDAAFQAQIDGEFATLDDGLRWLETSRNQANGDTGPEASQ